MVQLGRFQFGLGDRAFFVEFPAAFQLVFLRVELGHGDFHPVRDVLDRNLPFLNGAVGLDQTLLGLGERVLVVLRIDLRQDFALLDVTPRAAVRRKEFDVSRNFRRDGNLTERDHHAVHLERDAVRLAAGDFRFDGWNDLLQRLRPIRTSARPNDHRRNDRRAKDQDRKKDVPPKGEPGFESAFEK